MSADRKPLSREELDELLTSLDLVMQDAEQLRRTINQQLSDNRVNDRPQVTPLSAARPPRTRVE
jgi:hypothetical protein